MICRVCGKRADYDDGLCARCVKTNAVAGQMDVYECIAEAEKDAREDDERA